jgi:hypothetical protein
MFVRQTAATAFTCRVPLEMRPSLVAASRVKKQALSSIGVHRCFSVNQADTAPIIESVCSDFVCLSYLRLSVRMRLSGLPRSSDMPRASSHCMIIHYIKIC